MTVTRSSTQGISPGGGVVIGYKGVIDCSGTPDYPAATTGDIYIVSVAGKIGGVSGLVVTAGDMLVCKATASAGDQATVGSSWDVIQTNIDLSSITITGGSITGTAIGATTLSNSSAVTGHVSAVAAATYDLQVTDHILSITYTGTGPVTNLRLMTAQMVSGRTLVIKDTGGNAFLNPITVTTEGGETIDGQDTFVMNSNYQSINLFTNGSNWFVY